MCSSDLVHRPLFAAALWALFTWQIQPALGAAELEAVEIAERLRHAVRDRRLNRFFTAPVRRIWE